MRILYVLKFLNIIQVFLLCIPLARSKVGIII